MTTTTIARSTSQESNTPIVAIRPEAAYGTIVMRALDLSGPATPRQLARETGISELIIRSVLQALEAVDCIHFDRSTGCYSLYCVIPDVTAG